MKKYHDALVAVYVRGGVVQAIDTTGRSIQVYLVDYDNLDAGGPGELPESTLDFLFPASRRVRKTIEQDMEKVIQHVKDLDNEAK